MIQNRWKHEVSHMLYRQMLLDARVHCGDWIDCSSCQAFSV